VDYQRETMTENLGLWQAANEYKLGFSVRPPRNGSYPGTAGAVHQQMDSLPSGIEHVLVLAADHVYKMDYRKMLSFHQKVDADVTISVFPVPLEIADQFGILTADSEDRIFEFAEKPREPKSNLASMGVYIFKKTRLLQRLEEDAADAESAHDFGHSVLPRMVAHDRVFAYKFDKYWRDIGTVKAYYDANIEIMNHPSFLSPQDEWPVYTVPKEDMPAAAPQRINNKDRINA
jgi:glucose-1-phosphate adenylyltransferase